MITQELIQQLYQQILSEVQAIAPLHNWVIQPTSVEMLSHKSKYGQATKDGKIQISEFFLGTDAVEKLKNTLRHEFAHLCIGLSHHHNKVFRRVEKQFGVTEAGNDQQECQKILNKIPYKYTVFIHLMNGERVSLGGVHRKTKTYTEYDRNKQPYSHKGVPILRFEFVEN